MADVPQNQQQSPYYSPQPIFVPGGGPKRPSRLEGNRALLVVAVVVLVMAAATGVLYFMRGQQTQVYQDFGAPPAQQGSSPLLR